jgi:hypothetical protein
VSNLATFGDQNGSPYSNTKSLSACRIAARWVLNNSHSTCREVGEDSTTQDAPAVPEYTTYTGSLARVDLADVQNAALETATYL